MKAFMVYEPGKYGVVDAPMPDVKDDELLVKVGAAAICHSDIDIITGARKHFVKFPNITGHEFAGTVEGMGESVTGFKEGDTIASECMIWCGACRPCSLGHRGQCLNIDELGTMRNGGFAEYVAVPYRMAHKFSHITMDEAATAECASNGYNAVETASIVPGDIVVVIGPGPIGLFSMQFAKLKFPSQIIAVGTRDSRLEFAKKCGATSLVNINKEDAYESIMEITKGKGADVVIQCGTSLSAGELAVKVAGAHSRIIIEGLSSTGKGINLDFDQFIIKPMMIKGLTGGNSDHFECLIRLMEQGYIDAKKIITNKVSLDNIMEGFNMLSSKVDGVVKVIVKP